jgi:hypothetical protein
VRSAAGPPAQQSAHLTGDALLAAADADLVARIRAVTVMTPHVLVQAEAALPRGGHVGGHYAAPLGGISASRLNPGTR